MHTLLPASGLSADVQAGASILPALCTDAPAQSWEQTALPERSPVPATPTGLGRDLGGHHCPLTQGSEDDAPFTQLPK